jgi:hypothetical protein
MRDVDWKDAVDFGLNMSYLAFISILNYRVSIKTDLVGGLSMTIGLLKSKLCNPYLIVLSMHGILCSIKLDHKISHIRHLNSPGVPAAFIILRIL